MSKDYVVYLVGDERTVNYNTQRLIATLDNLPILKEKYKNEFNYFLGMRKNWFGLLLLGLIEECDNLALQGFKQLLTDKKFNRVYVHNLEQYRYNVNDVYSQKRMALHFTCYERDMDYVSRVIDKIMRQFGFYSVVEKK